MFCFVLFIPKKFISGFWGETHGIYSLNETGYNDFNKEKLVIVGE